MVEDFQHEAKKSFAMGKVMYKKAYEQFKKAIFYCEKMEPTPENKHLLATLYANCALIQMKKENYRSCLKDCNAALALEVRLCGDSYLQPRYKKVLYRKAKATFTYANKQNNSECYKWSFCRRVRGEIPK